MTPDDTLTRAIAAAKTLQRLAIRCTTEHDRIDIDRAGLPPELRDTAVHIAAAEPLVAARPFAVIVALIGALRKIEKGDAAVFDEDLQTEVGVAMGEEELRDIARAALAQVLALEAKKP